MNFNTYRYFNEVAETRSIRRAADRLHVAPSAISRQLALLEHQLGTLLLERSNTGIQLTPAGLLLERYTRTMFRDLERVQDSIRTLKGLRQGEVKLWAIEGLIFSFLPRAINKFNDVYPAIRFSVFTESTDRIIEAMIKDEADIGIVFNARPRPNIEIVASHTEPVMCLVASDHPFVDRKSLSLSEICTQQIALPVPSFGLRQLFDKAVSRRNLSANTIVSANNLELTRAMAITGRAITVGPALAASKEIDEGTLKAIPIDEEEFAAATSAICVHRDRRLSYAAHEFLKMLVKEFPSAGRAAA
ncbi:MAG: Transcriptional regulator, LysR family [Xanthobacteraceae bacterium]|jgi:DNA-binding transcriptional LysR family regulator|nr:Transcriptional regulator, LysR family [Xanthobacteraceae bacterium]